MTIRCLLVKEELRGLSVKLGRGRLHPKIRLLKMIDVTLQAN